MHASSAMLAALADTHERRDAAVADVPGVCLNATIDEFALLKMMDGQADVMCRIHEKHKAFATIEGGRRLSYLMLNKALCGCVQSTLLWHELFSSTLLSNGFKLNPYDLCVANPTIDGKQCTTCWHAGDSKISHQDPTVVSKIIEIW